MKNLIEGWGVKEDKGGYATDLFLIFLTALTSLISATLLIRNVSQAGVGYAILWLCLLLINLRLLMSAIQELRDRVKFWRNTRKAWEVLDAYKVKVESYGLAGEELQVETEKLIARLEELGE